MDLHAELKIALEAAAEPGRAAPMQAYMRDQFVFLGVATPQRRLAARGLLAGLKGIDADVLLEHAQLLWQQPQRECRRICATSSCSWAWRHRSGGWPPGTCWRV